MVGCAVRVGLAVEIVVFPVASSLFTMLSIWLISSSDKFGRYDSQGDEIANLDKKSLMQYACDDGTWINTNYRHVIEARKRSLKCGMKGEAIEFSV